VCCFVLYFLAAAASYNGFYQRWHFHEAGVAGAWSEKELGLDKALDSTAPRPYVYRQLLPAIANGVDAILPPAMKDAAIQQKLRSQQNPFTPPLIQSPLTANGLYLLRYYVVYLTDFLFALLAVFAMHGVCRSFGFSPVAAAFAPVAMILLFPCFLNLAGYYYDYPELAFFALTLWMARRYNWLWLLPVAALATWNKESFLFFVPTLYPIFRTRSGRWSALAGTASMTAVCAAVYGMVRSRYMGNAGGAVEVHWHEQLALLMHPLSLVVRVDDIYGIYMLSCCSLLPLALICWTVRRGWKRFSPELKRHAQIAAAINLPLFFFLCAPREMRDLSMLYMVLLLSVAAAIEGTFPNNNSRVLRCAAE
jgi:hypothetical protein